MKTNCFNMIFVDDNFIPFIRNGIPVTIKNNFVTLNGIGKYEVFRKPESIKDDDIVDEVFKDYSNSAPWLGKENDGMMYLYRIDIDENSLNIIDNTNKYKYLYVEALESEHISVLNGKIFFRCFIDGKQKSMIRCEEATVVRINKEETLVMIELVDGDFICR